MLGRCKQHIHASLPDHSTPIGCAITPDAVYLAQHNPAKPEQPILSHAIIRGSHEDKTSLQQALSAAFEKAPFIDRDLVIGMPRAATHYKQAHVANPINANTINQLRHKIAHELDCPPDELCIDYHTHPPGNAIESVPSEITVVVARTREVHRMTSVARNAGMRPIAIDCTCAAIARALSRYLKDAPACIVDLNERTPIISIVERDSLHLVYPVNHKPTNNTSDQDTRSGGARPHTTQHARRIATQVNLCLHHLESRASTQSEYAHPEMGILISAPETHSVYINALNQSLLPFSTLAEITAERPLIEHDQNESALSIDQWALPIGLSMYTQPQSSMRAAA